MKMRLHISLLLSSVWVVTAAQSIPADSALAVAKQLYARGDSFIYSRQPDSAAYYLDSALHYTKQNLGNDHPFAGLIAHALGYVYMGGEDKALAKSVFEEALRIKRIHFTPPHAELAVTLNSLGIIHENEGNVELAETLYLDARDNWAGSYGKDHLRYSWAQHNLGRMYNRLGRADEAVECLTDALRIKQANLPSDDPELGHTLVFLSAALSQLGDIAGYEACALRAADIWKKQKGVNDVLYYWSRHNLAHLNVDLGHYEMAISLGREALEGKIRVYGNSNPDVALTLLTLANAYSGLEQYDSAYTFLILANSIYERQAQGSIEHAWCLNNLGKNRYLTGAYETAGNFLHKSLAIKKELIDTSNADYFSTLLNYARVRIMTQDLDTAELMVQQAKTFFEIHDLTRNENYLFSLDLLTQIQYRMNAYDEAFSTQQRANQISSENITAVTGFASEGELFSFLQYSAHYLNQYFTVARHVPNLTASARTDLCNQVLFHKGFLLEKYLEIRRQTQWDSTSLRLYQALLTKKKLLALQLTKLPADRQGVESLEEKISSLERELSERLKPVIKPELTFESIRNKLKADEVAIEFVENRQNLPVYQDSTWYSAMLIAPGLDVPVIIPLFEERALRALLPDTSGTRLSNADGLYQRNDSGLYNLIWTSLLPYVNHVKRIYFSSTGLLHRINFTAIPTADGWVLGDKYELIQFITTSSILNQEPLNPRNKECILAGGIRYEIDTTGLPVPVVPGPDNSTPDSDKMVAMLRGKEWNYLQGTEKEIDHISQLVSEGGLEPIVWKGFEATEEQFKSLGRSAYRTQSPYLIHLSTHGYFFPDIRQDAPMEQRSAGLHMIRDADNPLIRSGLLLSGGNYAWKNGKAMFPWMEDGILTAYEIGPMDLSDTELVVLSACETGLGDIQGHEGVYGLQRAFKMAGVQYILMSLWQVPDAATAELMSRFYTYWLNHHYPVRQALYSAQREMREEGYEPRDWAGFILIE